MARRAKPSVSLSAREQAELRKCALMAAATSYQSDIGATPEQASAQVVDVAERFMAFLVSGDGSAR